MAPMPADPTYLRLVFTIPDDLQRNLMTILSSHIGRENAIGRAAQRDRKNDVARYNPKYWE
jgi:hypothetical protein